MKMLVLIVSLATISCSTNNLERKTASATSVVPSTGSTPQKSLHAKAPAELPCTSYFCENTLTSLSQYESMNASVKLGAKKLKVVKVVYKRDKLGSGDVYFMNTRNYAYHFDFSQAFLKVKSNLNKFNKNYQGSGENRDYNLASLVLWDKEQKIFLLELWNGDTLDVHHVSELINQVKKDIQIPGAKVLYHPLGKMQEEEVEGNQYNIEFVKTSELFKNIDYIALNTGSAVGYVRFIEPNADVCLDNTSIAVFSKIPNDIGLLGGVITEEFQTPLSHINVKSINRGTINFTLKNARKVLAPYEGKPIRLSVTGEKYTITILDERRAKQEIKLFWESRKPRLNFESSVVLEKKYDDRFVNLQNFFRGLPTKEQHRKLTLLVGAKASNIALLGQMNTHISDSLLKIKTPQGFGVPFNFYDQFMSHKQKGLDLNEPNRLVSPQTLLLEKLNSHELLDPTKESSFCKVKPVLADIREMIQRAAVPKEMLAVYKRYILTDEKSPIHIDKVAKIRLRSSTNSEDMEGFSGAGLYNSTGIWFYRKGENGERKSDRPKSWKKIKKSLKEKIPYIYSSVWNDRAFEEREWYSINGQKHMDIKVAIALHRGFPFKELDSEAGEVVNGVAITADLNNRKDTEKIYINSQHFDLAVTNPPTKEELIEKSEDPTKDYSTEEVLITTFVADPKRNYDPRSWLEWPYQVLSKSSVNKEKPVLIDNLTKEAIDSGEYEVRKLAKVFKRLGELFAGVYRKRANNFVLDIEWKLIGEARELWIKQARPFNQNAQQNDSTAMRTDPNNIISQPNLDVIITRGPKRPKQ